MDGLDDLVESVLPTISKANRNNVYRTLRSYEINRVPEEKKEQTKKFKEYEPGYLHIVLTYQRSIPIHNWTLALSKLAFILKEDWIRFWIFKLTLTQNFERSLVWLAFLRY